MTRPLRIELAGALYHVTSRGDRREDIYADEVDRLAWLALFDQVCRRFNWTCHGWCQMTNHYHLIVETAEGNLAQGMRQLNGVYTQNYNRRHGRVGHVFQGRYKAILVEKDNYLLELARYVVLNPVRAGMVAEAADWAWSSYSAMIDQAPQPTWLQTDWILGQFGTHRQSAIGRYREFVRNGVGVPSLWDQLRGQVFLGSEAFIKQVSANCADIELREISRAQRRAMAKTLSEYASTAANAKEAMYHAYASGSYSMQEIADYFSVHYATVSRNAKHWEVNLLDCKT